jgi:hypothetical protein
MDGLAMALHAVYHTTTFGEAITAVINMLGDADTTGAIAGQIAGAFYGAVLVGSAGRCVTRLCARCNRPAAKHCSGCKAVHYCTPECQRQHWQDGHKQVCGATKQQSQEGSDTLVAATTSSSDSRCVDQVWVEQMRRWDGGGEIELRAISLYQMGKAAQ